MRVADVEEAAGLDDDGLDPAVGADDDVLDVADLLAARAVDGGAEQVLVRAEAGAQRGLVPGGEVDRLRQRLLRGRRLYNPLLLGTAGGREGREDGEVGWPGSDQVGFLADGGSGRRPAKPGGRPWAV